MDRYSKYFLQHILYLDDGFNKYYVQDKAWGRQEILDVESVRFNWPEEAEQWLNQCAKYEDYITLRRLRVFLSNDCAEPYHVHRMNDRQVLRAAARQLTHGFFQIVIKPRLGWAVKVDAQTQTPKLPIVVEPAPDIDGMLSQLQDHLNGMVAEQKRQYDQLEAKLAAMDDAEKALLYSKKGGEGLYNATIGSVVGLVKSLPGLAKKAAVVWWKFKTLPLRLANSTVAALLAGSWGPLKQEVHQIVGPVVQSAEKLKRVTAMVAILLSEPVTRDILLDFVERYWDNTHPLEKTEMGAEAASEVVLTILLALFTAGVGAAANIAAKSGRLVKVVKLLEKIAVSLKRVSSFRKLPKKRRGGGVSGFFKKKKPKKKGMPEPKPPKKKVGGDGPKTTEKETVTVYRVDDNDFDPRISSDGSVPVVKTRKGKERALFINIDQPQRAKEFAKVNRKNNATITAVDADASLLEKLRTTAVEDTSAAAKLNPNAPLKVDMNKAPDQYGLRTPEQIKSLRDAIDPSTVRTVDPDDL